ncbi:Stb5p KNAG_0E00780 [Huiozyma naganishii CBS 8797]|uniref:Zn(2)-C6 fungal-type domain-containing protein n=1 Tax=Huiozyma naganishii (strain ATCC MYA-139 / BCRC 22969 / CBS 8797 / KCTC 17520 / NBRC 10181 / NCYC 3082 / Yp74L-3) TaxID=1071383 RepID=J7S7H6_HUIN7|nr:hypothetical protein KNAG_0E00780 [Kazachstania naganishii CBS 8797]CCK70346.1 hypothetical protein KNAG_0E00780 [Kazachstania naganishii CBS 8797]
MGTPLMEKRVEGYSCSRCRKLKKKCLREVPACSHCLRAEVVCHYPGRAPRRTKRELEEATRRGEGPRRKRGKPPLQFPDADAARSLEALHRPGSAPANPLSTSIGSDLSMQGRALPGSQVYENVSSLICALTNSIPDSDRPQVEGQDPATAAGTAQQQQNDKYADGSAESHILHKQADPPLSNILTGSTESTFETNKSALSSSYQTERHPLSDTTSPDSWPRNGQTKLETVPNQLPPFSISSPAFHPNSNLMAKHGNSMPPMLSQHDIFADQQHDLEKADSTPITAASIEIATVGNVFKGGRSSPCVNSNGSYKAIERALLDRFIAAYFRHNHRLFPMIDKIAFLNQISSIGEFNYELLCERFDSVFVFKVYMIMSIGCTTLRRAGMLLKDEEELSEHLAYLAMRNFCYVMNLQNMETIRCLLLLGIYSFFEPKGWSSWTISGIIMRLAIGLGLNRHIIAKKLKTIPVMELEARYRVFWSAYCFERLVATCLGRVSAIEDDDISIPFPQPLYDGEKEDIEVTRTMISLRRMGGRIYKQVHSVSVAKKNLSLVDKNKIISELREELDDVYEHEKEKMDRHNAEHKSSATSVISFHSSGIWLAMRYSQLMILLYRPSTLIPKPPIESLSVLGQFCLEAWKHTYTLYQKRLLPLNWITLFRTLTICNTILYCLCQWSIDLIESKIEIQQCVEILQHFGEKWVFASKCAEVFQNVSNTILDISLSDGKVPNMDKLTHELFGASDAYHDILDENNVDVSWVDRLT